MPASTRVRRVEASMRTLRTRRRAGVAVLAAAGAVAVTALGGGSASGAGSCPTPPAGQDRPWLDASYSADCRAQYVVAALPAVADKIAALDGNAKFEDMGIYIGGLEDG